jgi:hypothetical protein
LPRFGAAVDVAGGAGAGGAERSAPAAAWYRVQRPGLDADFLAAVSRTLSGLQDAPLRHAMTWLELRRALVRKFPFAVYFRVWQGSVHVVAVLHLHRDASTIVPGRI